MSRGREKPSFAEDVSSGLITRWHVHPRTTGKGNGAAMIDWQNPLELEKGSLSLVTWKEDFHTSALPFQQGKGERIVDEKPMMCIIGGSPTHSETAPL